MSFPPPRFPRLTFLLALAGLGAGVAAPALAAVTSSPSQPRDLLPYARPMCGTGGWANTFPGAVVPFGMVQWSPDTEAGKRKGGYSVLDHRISGFGLDHVNGAGCDYGEDFQFMPLLGTGHASPAGNRTAFATGFTHAHEVAKPGYYSVVLDNGIKTELTTTVRSGFGRFTYPAGQPATMAINAASDVNGSADAAIDIDPAHRAVSGWSAGGYFCHARARTVDFRTIYFYAVFDHPFQSYATWSGKAVHAGLTHGQGTAAGAFVTFAGSGRTTVLAKVGISYVSVANAKSNLEAENPTTAFASADFDHTAQAAGEIWNHWLNRIEVDGGTREDRTKFYSMLYHALIAPTVVSDANGEYFGYDGRVHTTRPGRRQYGFFSGWDVYRSECQLLAMLAPKEASDMAQSLLRDYQQGGAFPRWGVATEDSGVMMGDPAAAMIADFYTYGARDFDAKDALAGLVRAATDPGVYAPRTKTYERDALADYLKLGYVPEHQKGGYGPVSMTLEYDSADFALAQFAQALGDAKDAAMLLRHAQNWKNHYNPQSGYLEMRRRDGSWAPGFTPTRGVYDHYRAYVEGTAAQYVWMVPFNLKGLAEKMGGADIAARRLDTFFTQLNAGVSSPYANLGNEPCLEAPWIYCFLNRPYRTQALVRRVLDELFSAEPNAYPGNDDLGEMSSWFIFGALGMYPELPGSDVLVLGSPLFPRAVLHLPHGDVVIEGQGARRDAPYVHGLTVNGQAWHRPWIRYPDIVHGGTLSYQLAGTPDRAWGSDPADAPPSYDAPRK